MLRYYCCALAGGAAGEEVAGVDGTVVDGVAVTDELFVFDEFVVSAGTVLLVVV